MKLKNKSSTKKPLPLIAIILVLLGLGVWLAYTNNTWPFPSTANPNTNTPDASLTKDQKAADIKANQDSKREFLEQNKGNINPGTEVPMPESPNTIDLIAIQSSAAQVVISTKLHGYADGACSLTVKNGTRTITKDVQILYQPEFSTCKGFVVETSQLGIGKWGITLSVTPTGGSAITKQVVLEVK